MTDKIIINKVDVSNCIHLDEWKHCNCCKDLVKTKKNRIGQPRTTCVDVEDLECEFYPYCYYKKLARKIAECENLEIRMNRLCQSQGDVYYDYYYADKRALEFEELAGERYDIIENLENLLKMSKQHNNDIVKQNQSLQTEARNFRRALAKIREINIECKGCNGDCTFCASGTNREVYNISTEILGIKEDV